MSPDLFELHRKVLEDSSLTFQQKLEMFNEIRKLMPPSQNRWNFRYAILPLAITTLAVPIYSLAALSLNIQFDIPEALLSLSSTALGAIAAFLTNNATKQVTPNQESGTPP